MRLLFEEAIAMEPMNITKKITIAGGEYNHYDLKYAPQDYCAVTIIRSGDSMLNEAFNLLSGITVGKILVQRDE